MRRGGLSVAAPIGCVAVLTCALAAGQTTADVTAKVRGGPFPWRLALYDRQGNVVRTVGEPTPDNYPPPAFSPDGTRLAVVQAISNGPGTDLSVFDLSTGANTRMSAGPVPRDPIWSPDGSQIAYYALRQDSGGLYRKPSSGSGREELLYRFPPGVTGVHVTDWSPDGRFLVFDTSAVVWMLPLAGERAEGRKPVELVRQDFDVFGARLSPDGRFLAYNSDESGRNEVYVRAFDPSSIRGSAPGRQVSSEGALGVISWRRDGRELYYLAPDGAMMAVDVATTPTFTAEAPRFLFRLPNAIPVRAELEGNPNDDPYGRVSPDGQRFVFAVPAPPDRKVVTVPPEILEQYTGTYSAGGNPVVISLEGTQLMILGATPKVPLFPETETSFFRRNPGGDVDFEFVKDDRGRVTHFDRFQGGAGARWTRADPRAEATVTAPSKPRGGNFPRQLTVYDRQGNVVRTVGELNHARPALSPDGTRLAAVGGSNIWVFDLPAGTRTRLTSLAMSSGSLDPVWSPDGKQLAYYSFGRDYPGLYRQTLSGGPGSEQLLYELPPAFTEVYGIHWSQDGRFLTFDTDGVLWLLPLTGERTPVQLVREEYRVSGARLSPDSRLLAYNSMESGEWEVYVRAFDPSSKRFVPGGRKWKVSDHGGLGMIEWRRDGRELYYLASDGGMMAVDVTDPGAFTTRPPRLLFKAPAAVPITPQSDYEHSGSIASDGQTFAFAVTMPPPDRRVVTVAPDILTQYTGAYVGPEGPGYQAVVTLEGNQLMLKFGFDEKVRLLAESDTYFFRRTSRGDTDVEFVKEKGQVARFVEYSGGAGVAWTRK